VGLLYRVDRSNYPRRCENKWTSERVQEIRSRWSEAGGVDPPLAVATLSRGLPNLMGDEARICGICWANRGGAEVRVDIAACK